MEKSDSLLVEETLKGKLSSFEILLKRYQDKILKRTIHLLGNREDAEDATQETFIRAYKKLDSFKLEMPFSPWIYKIATNYCFDLLKKRKLQEKLSFDVESEEKSLVDQVIQIDQIEKLIIKLRKLPEIYKQPLIGYYFFELDYQDLSRELNMPLNTLRTRLKRGKEMLSKELAYEGI